MHYAGAYENTKLKGSQVPRFPDDFKYKSKSNFKKLNENTETGRLSDVTHLTSLPSGQLPPLPSVTQPARRACYSEVNAYFLTKRQHWTYHHSLENLTSQARISPLASAAGSQVHGEIWFQVATQSPEGP